MNNLTKVKIARPANEVFEAFVDPLKIGNFWFTSSSERWKPGKTIEGEPHLVSITLRELDPEITIVEVNEVGFDETDAELVNKW